jgi:hypothetical protein
MIRYNARMATIDTGKCERRRLRFESIDDVLKEVDRLAELDRAGRLTCLGNWTFGQIIGHLATWSEYAFTPAPLKTPWFIRVILKMRKNRMINGEMPAGVKIPGVPHGTLGTEPAALDVSLPRYRAALERLRREAPTAPSPAFGMLTQEESIKLNLRHAELHLGFVRERS